MIRGIGSRDTSVLQIRPFSGASVGDITEELEKDTSQYNEVIIVTGGNDCERNCNTTTEISAAVNSLLLKAKKKAPSVKIASVLHRPKKPAMQLKVDHVNEDTRQMCKRMEGCQYIDNDGSFKLADQSPNEAFYVADRVHLNYQGNIKLIKNLGIEDYAIVKRSRRSKSDVSTSRDYKHQWGQQSEDEGEWNLVQHRDVRCHNCGEKGHVVKTCRFNRKITCFSCGSQGHKSKSCPN